MAHGSPEHQVSCLLSVPATPVPRRSPEGTEWQAALRSGMAAPLLAFGADLSIWLLTGPSPGERSDGRWPSSRQDMAPERVAVSCRPGACVKGLGGRCVAPTASALGGLSWQLLLAVGWTPRGGGLLSGVSGCVLDAGAGGERTCGLGGGGCRS